MATLPLGGLYFAWSTLMAVAPIRRPRWLAVGSWICSMFPNELPFVCIAIVVVSTVPAVGGGDITPSAAVALALGVATVAGLVVCVWRALHSKLELEQALTAALGTAWRSSIDPALVRRFRRHLPWPAILLLPWGLRRPDVERVRDVPYDDGGVHHLLDVYRHRSRPSPAPTLLYLHGGGFRWGRKSREARPLLHRLASQGWTCVSANYRLSPTPGAGFPDHLVDVKRVIAWARGEGVHHGVDPDSIFLAGSSAGAHLTAMAALTANDPRLQPGFESADTSITAGIGLGGYYGPLGDHDDLPSTPVAHVRPGAPPFLVVHGANDTFTPVDGARHFADRLRAVSRQPVAYAELPGGQHAFDLFRSIRFETVVDRVEAFTAWVRSNP